MTLVSAKVTPFGQGKKRLVRPQFFPIKNLQNVISAMNTPPLREPRFTLPLQRSFPKIMIGENEDSSCIRDYIQSHGILFVLEKDSLNICRVSDNTLKLLGIDPYFLLGKNLRVLLEANDIEALEACTDTERIARGANHVPICIQNQTQKLEFDGLVQCQEDCIILELEPKQNFKTAKDLDFYPLVRGSLAKFRKAESVQELCDFTAQELRQITECDRAMVYQFDPDGNGRVIAEDKREDLEPFLGLNYPALDIPEASRNLLLKNLFRSICDIEASPAYIIPHNQPLDLSLSVLRGVSPCHIEYLRNMGVRASIGISILKNKKLWGLVVCHYISSKYISYQVRAACELLCQIVSSELLTKEENRDYQYRLEISSIQSNLLEAMSNAEKFQDALIEHKQDFLKLVSAGGAAIYSGREIVLLGQTPPREIVQKLLKRLGDKSFQQNIFYTDCLARWEPAIAAYKDVASGMLAVAISPQPKKYLLWFRPEIVQTVRWAGDPSPQTQVGSDGIVGLCPRKSFEMWKETVRLTSLSWQQYEIDAALELRKAIINVVLRQADELAELNMALRQSEARQREKAKELKSTLCELKQTQTQLIHNEKMSSLGQLVAGVAHELNNPINFIGGNLRYAQEYANNLLSLVELYSQYYPSPPIEIESKIEAVEFDFLREDFPKLMSSMKLGAERISKLVSSLRNFSRLDESDMKPVDIHEGIDNTLVILNNRFKAKPDRPNIQIVKEYGNLPLVECHASQLNQVFMNLIANGVDALEERDLALPMEEVAANPSTITIRTESIGESEVIISIIDNALGMPEEVAARIFDPFFTTKPIGKGTGLGLAISHQIVVEKHKGKLHCISTPGVGTEFRIEIPLKFNPAPSVE
ncbi:ATP-binding protein [Oscillatoria sp. FACHB-1406]|uniref:ATP-binding protein n=1 Tax=Oscillatoria sp. FACHB-1406 TaxID=2692846 RepID=UPI001688FFC1|nr:ATP-binding protein [Oscillatoria sp. FACHB-1406]MBD2579493.1 GAF domain-containing protein [Oscillatoria sp. FACHB-1406]